MRVRELFLVAALVFATPGAGQGQWELQLEDWYNNALSFPDNQNGWVCGTGGTVHFTHDGGLTWDRVLLDLDCQANTDIHFMRPSEENGSFEGWMSNGNVTTGRMLHSVDDGLTWIIRLEMGHHLETLFVLDRDHIWGGGDAGKIVSTIDRGETWAVADLGVDERVSSIFFRNAALGWACTLDGKIFGTLDSGVTWSQQMNVGAAVRLQDLYFLSDQEGYCVGGTCQSDQARTYRTLNGGMSWQNHTSPPGMAGGRELVWLDTQTAWVAGGEICGYDMGSISHTNDGGITWVDDVLPTVSSVQDIDMTSAGEGWCVTRDGEVLHWSQDATGMEQSQLADLRIGPVPAADHLDVFGSGMLGGRLTLGDASGRVLRTAGFNGHMRLDIAGLAPGSYFLSIEDRTGSTITRRFVKH